MSSSQGAATGSGTSPSQIPGEYDFSRVSIRDSSDWTRYVKERRVFKATKAFQTEDPWIPYGNAYRLTFLNGKFKSNTPSPCEACRGNAFGGLKGPLTPSS